MGGAYFVAIITMEGYINIISVCSSFLESIFNIAMYCPEFYNIVSWTLVFIFFSPFTDHAQYKSRVL